VPSCAIRGGSNPRAAHETPRPTEDSRVEWLCARPHPAPERPVSVDSSPIQPRAQSTLRGRGHIGVDMTPQNAQHTAAPAVTVEFRISGVAFVKLLGEHDFSSKQRLSEALAKASSRRDVFVDLSECTFIDSSVIAALFTARTKLELRHGRLELVIPPGTSAVRRVAELTTLGAILRIHDSRRAALASLRTGEHSIVVRDLRLRFGHTESYAAECSCGWKGQTHTGWQSAAREARRDGVVHVDEQRAGQAGAGRR
jgi:anti-sigma B factor antagonist